MTEHTNTHSQKADAETEREEEMMLVKIQSSDIKRETCTIMAVLYLQEESQV